jgi:hypothetical protein
LLDLQTRVRTAELRPDLPHTPTVPPTTVASPPSHSEMNNSSVSSFPSPISTVPAPNSETLPFTLQSPHAVWAGKTLRVRFAIQYLKNDQGNQQGRILVLARGPAGILTYPKGAMNLPGQEGMVSTDKGEFFSVSRYREVKADFGPVQSQSDLQMVEIYILSKEGLTLRYEKIPLQKSENKKEKTKKPVAVSSEIKKEDQENAATQDAPKQQQPLLLEEGSHQNE